MAETTLDIKSLGDWTEPKRVQTKFGPRDLREAASIKPTFWDAWRAHKDEMKMAGISIKKEGTQWKVMWWAAIPADEQKRMEDTLEASRALEADMDIPVPEGLEYLPFQKAGIKFLSTRPNSLLGDEMGVGKTIQSIGLINLNPKLENILIVCPSALKLNWKRELQKWLVRDLSITVATPQLFESGKDITIINYDLLRKYESFIQMRDWQLLIVDECHMAKNPKAQRSKLLYSINASRKVFLTGTPILNRPKEIYPLIAALDPETWNKDGKGQFRFARRYCGAYKDRFGFHDTGNSNLDELQKRLRSTIMIRRLKKDVLTELPKKFRQVIEFTDTTGLSKTHQAMIEAFEANIAALRVKVELAKASDNPKDYEDAVAELKKGVEVNFTEMAKMRHETAMAKVPLVTRHVRDIVDEGNKVIVFAHHRDVQDALMAEFGDIAVMHRGGMTDDERDANVEKFQTDANIKVFVGSIQASGVGITLTASNLVIFVELDWVPGKMSQAEDRAHRIGQKDNVNVQHLVLEGSIDANMAQTLIEKQIVIDKALDAEPAEAQQIVFPAKKKAATESASKKKIEELATTMSPDKCIEIHNYLKRLAAVCDFAEALDGQGFNGVDAPIGHSLANAPFLTPKQAALGSKLVHKYRRQLGIE